ERPALDLQLAGDRRFGQVDAADRVVAADRGQRAGAEGGAVEVVVVDVDGDATVSLVVAAAVLVEALVLGPEVAGDVGVDGVLAAVPVGDPDRVRFGGTAAGGVGEVGNPGTAAAVDGGDVAERVQLFGPGG